MDYDVIIAGGGCAGLTAAIYSARAGMECAVLEAKNAGGQIVSAPEVENYPALPKISGAEFGKQLLNQAQSFGAKIIYRRAESFEIKQSFFNVLTSDKIYSAKALIIASGVKRRKLNVIGEDRLLGRGVSYCAVCDGMFFKNKTVCVAGGGNSALEDTLYLSDICKKVYLIHRRNEFRAESIVTDALKGKNNIEYVLNNVVESVNGSSFVTGVTVKDVKSGTKTKINADALFVAIGKIPDTGPIINLLENKDGYIVTDSNMQTSVNGIFAAGDCRLSKVKQLTTATSDGTLAALAAAEYIKKL